MILSFPEHTDARRYLYWSLCACAQFWWVKKVHWNPRGKKSENPEIQFQAVTICCNHFYSALTGSCNYGTNNNNEKTEKTENVDRVHAAKWEMVALAELEYVCVCFSSYQFLYWECVHEAQGMNLPNYQAQHFFARFKNLSSLFIHLIVLIYRRQFIGCWFSLSAWHIARFMLQQIHVIYTLYIFIYRVELCRSHIS